MAGGYDNSEDHENGEQSQRETAAHRLRSWARCPETIQPARYARVSVGLKVHENFCHRRAGWRGLASRFKGYTDLADLTD
jgi:hypothetical protein